MVCAGGWTIYGAWHEPEADDRTSGLGDINTTSLRFHVQGLYKNKYLYKF